VLNFVRGYLEVDEDQDPHTQQKRLARQRREVRASVRTRLIQDYQGRYVRWPLFRWLLDHIEFHTRQRDTMHFEWTRLFPPIRIILKEVAQRWIENGLIAQPNDIFYLTLEELEAICVKPQPVIEIIQARRLEYEANKVRPWPVIIRGDQEIYSQETFQTQTTLDCLQGISGSPGLVTGRACVIQTPEEFNRLQEGDILVAPITNPVWTPLFAIASGVVTEVGGILSHGAIVAREYGIPAVMSVANITRRVLDGETIRVDGNKGLVYLRVGRPA